MYEKGRGDISICADLHISGVGRGCLPLVFFEFTRDMINKKRAQCFEYALAVRHMAGGMEQKLGGVLCCIVAIHSESACLYEIRLYLPTISEEFEFDTTSGTSSKRSALADILLAEGVFRSGSDDFSRVCETMAHFAAQSIRAVASGQPFKLPVDGRATAAEIGQERWKIFDYRSLINYTAVPPSERRLPDLFKTYVLGAKITLVSDNLSFVQYPSIDGTHRPSVVGHFISGLQLLMKMKASNHVHGDLRLANIIFKSDQSTGFIDWDLGGVCGTRLYLPNFNPDIEDGRRHSDARPDNKLQFEHDWFAFAAIMEFYTPAAAATNTVTTATDSTVKDSWSSAFDLVRGGKLSAAIDILQPLTKVRLVPVSGWIK